MIFDERKGELLWDGAADKNKGKRKQRSKERWTNKFLEQQRKDKGNNLGGACVC